MPSSQRGTSQTPRCLSGEVEPVPKKKENEKVTLIFSLISHVKIMHTYTHTETVLVADLR